jgi:hypothetical protein
VNGYGTQKKIPKQSHSITPHPQGQSRRGAEGQPYRGCGAEVFLRERREEEEFQPYRVF